MQRGMLRGVMTGLLTLWAGTSCAQTAPELANVPSVTAASVAMAHQLLDLAESETIHAYQNASPAVVTLQAGNGAGTGVIVDARGWVITNQHVLATPDQISATLSDGRACVGRLLGASRQPGDDLALVGLECTPQKGSYPAMSMADSDRVQVGQGVLAIGNPFGLDWTLTRGIVSRWDRARNRIQTDAAINPGNSGGPLLNRQGQMVGLIQAILNPAGRSNAGIAFAIPTRVVREFVSAYERQDPQRVSRGLTRARDYFQATEPTAPVRRQGVSQQAVPAWMAWVATAWSRCWQVICVYGTVRPWG